MRFVFTLLAMSLAVSMACKKSGDPSKEPGMMGSNAAGSSSEASSAAGSSATGSGSSMAGGSADTTGAAAPGSGSDSPAVTAGAGASAATAAAEAMAHRAGMCPSTVLGATTRSVRKGDAVLVTVESQDKDAIAAIQRRTDELLARKRDAPTGAGHDQKGTHGGAQGLCPVYLPEGATAIAKRKPRGITVAITPKDKPDDLARDIDARIAKAAAWTQENIKDGDKQNQGGVGGGKGEDGSNHSGKGDGKGHERRKGGGGGAGTGGGGGAGNGKRS
jgi:hypothetical protein